MEWIKHVWIDIGVTVVLVLATYGNMEWAWWAIAVYTPFMVLLKVAAYAGRHTAKKFRPTDAGVPPVLYHVLYGANVLIAAYDRWWWMAAAWLVIWVLSAISGRGKPAAK